MLGLPAACCRLLLQPNTQAQSRLLGLRLAPTQLACSSTACLSFLALISSSGAATGAPAPGEPPPVQPPPLPRSQVNPDSLARIHEHWDVQSALLQLGLHPAAAAAVVRELQTFPRLAADAVSAPDHYRELRQLFGPDASSSLVERFPRVLLLQHSVSGRVADLADLLSIGTQEAKRLILSLPELVRARHATLQDKVARLALLLGVSRQQAGRLAARWPRLLITSSRALQQKLDRYLLLLSCSPDKLRQLMCQQPRMLLSGTRLLGDQVMLLSELFEVPVDRILTLVVSYPALLSLGMPNIQAKVTALTSLLQADAATVKAALLQNPRLLSLNMLSVHLKMEALHSVVRTHPQWLAVWRTCSVSMRLRALCCSQAVLDRLRYVASRGLQGANSWTYLLVMPSRQFELKHPGFPAWSAARAQKQQPAGASHDGVGSCRHLAAEAQHPNSQP